VEEEDTISLMMDIRVRATDEMKWTEYCAASVCARAALDASGWIDQIRSIDQSCRCHPIPLVADPKTKNRPNEPSPPTPPNNHTTDQPTNQNRAGCAPSGARSVCAASAASVARCACAPGKCPLPITRLLSSADSMGEMGAEGERVLQHRRIRCCGGGGGVRGRCSLFCPRIFLM
jgi:hypothetical protein